MASIAARRKAATSSSTSASQSPLSQRCLPPVVRQTSARSRASNSSTPWEASMTSGPDIARRPRSLMTTKSVQRATIPMPPKQPFAAPISAITGMPASRASSTARITSETAIKPALASCRRTPPESSSSSTAAGRSRSARRSRPTSLAPCTSPTPPPMKAPSCAATKTVRPSRRARPIATPSSKAEGTPSCARCGLITRSAGGSHSWKLPGSSSCASRSRALHSA